MVLMEQILILAIVQITFVTAILAVGFFGLWAEEMISYRRKNIRWWLGYIFRLSLASLTIATIRTLWL
jgi:hypothetical protein